MLLTASDEAHALSLQGIFSPLIQSMKVEGFRTKLRGVATYTQKRICVHIWAKKYGKLTSQLWWIFSVMCTKRVRNTWTNINLSKSNFDRISDDVGITSSEAPSPINTKWMRAWSYRLFIIYHYKECVHLGKQRKPWCDTAFCGVSSGSTLFVLFIMFPFRMHSACSTSAYRFEFKFRLATPLDSLYDNGNKILYMCCPFNVTGNPVSTKERTTDEQGFWTL